MVDVRRWAKQAAVAADRVVAPPAGVVVLIYHRVGGGSDSAVDLDPEVFDRQLGILTERFSVLRLGDALDRLAVGEDVSGVVVTFDDGTADFVDVALPLLQRHQVPATLYVATQFVEEQVPFPWGAPPATWDGLAAAVATGLVEVGSHSHSHHLLDRQTPEAVGADLDTSIELITERLGRRPEHFAYPKAVPGSTAAEALVAARFASAALAGNRVNRPGRTDRMRLGRTPIQRGDGGELFERKAAGGMRLEGSARSLVARFKYRQATR